MVMTGLDEAMTARLAGFRLPASGFRRLGEGGRQFGLPTAARSAKVGGGAFGPEAGSRKLEVGRTKLRRDLPSQYASPVHARTEEAPLFIETVRRTSVRLAVVAALHAGLIAPA